MTSNDNTNKKIHLLNKADPIYESLFSSSASKPDREYSLSKVLNLADDLNVNPEAKIEVDLSEGRLTGLDIDRLLYRHPMSAESAFLNIALNGADMTEVHLSRVNMNKVIMNNANLTRADLRFTPLKGVHLQSANLQYAKLTKADLEGAQLQKADLREADLRGANLQGADLTGAFLNAAQLQGANLKNAILKNAILPTANLEGANLKGTKLDEVCDMQSANLESTCLEEVNSTQILVLEPNELKKHLYVEQHRIIFSFLLEEARKHEKYYEVNLSRPRSLVNFVVEYLTDSDSKFRHNRDKILKLATLLLEPSGAYGANEGEEIPYSHQVSIINDWIQHAIFGMSFNDWFLSKVIHYQKNTFSLTHHSMKDICIAELNNFYNNEYLTNRGELSPYAIRYYQYHVLNPLMPILMLKPNNEEQELNAMPINGLEWAYLHVGSRLLADSGVEISNMTLDDIKQAGMLLNIHLDKGEPTEYYEYFRLPAIIHYISQQDNVQYPSDIKEDKIPDIYKEYFDYLESIQTHPAVAMTRALENWKTRPQLATDELKKNNISETELTNYLNATSNVEFSNKNNHKVTLPNINDIFEKQNKEIVNLYKPLGIYVLDKAFNTMSDEEKTFFKNARITFNRFILEQSIKNFEATVPQLGCAIIAKMQEFFGVHKVDCAKYTFPQIDLINCISDNVIRFYILKKEEKDSIVSDYRYTFYLKAPSFLENLSPTFSTLLKNPNEPLSVMTNNLSKIQAKRINDQLHNLGYERSRGEIIEDILLSLIPFYTFYTKNKKGEYSAAYTALALDLLGFFFAGINLINIYNKLGTKLTIVTVNTFRTAITKANVINALKDAGYQVSNMLTKKDFIELTIASFRAVDPGIELLTLGGIKGIKALKNLCDKTKDKFTGLNKLATALEKREKAFLVKPFDPSKIKKASLPYFNKPVDVINIGNEKGKDIWVRINVETGVAFGQKHIRNAKEQLECVPITFREKIYQLKTEGLSGRGAPTAGRLLAARDVLYKASATSEERLNAFITLLRNRTDNITLDLSGANLADLDIADRLIDPDNQQRLLFSNINLENINLMRSNLRGIETLGSCNLYRADLAEANLQGAHLQDAMLEGANLQGANLQGANLNRADLEDANLQRANLQEVNLHSADLADAILREVNLHMADLEGANLENATLEGANLRWANLREVNLHSADLEDANLQGAHLQKAHLKEAMLGRANLRGANLREVNLHSADLAEADLQGAHLQDAMLEGANLQGANLQGANLDRTNLEEAILEYANLQGAYLQDAMLEGTNLREANLEGASLRGANLEDAILEDAALEHAILEYANLKGAHLQDAVMERANLQGANLNRTNLNRTDLEGANLQGAHLQDAMLEGANLEGANLQGAHLQDAMLEGANLEGANLQGAHLQDAMLEGANLEGANLEGANLHGANLEEADIEYVNLQGANLQGANLNRTDLGGANLQGAHLQDAMLEGANLKGANLKGANLKDANLQGANMRRINLEGANLEGANLEGVILVASSRGRGG